MESAWLEEASTWIHDACAQIGREVTGEITQPHLRPWSTVLRVPARGGDLFFKASAPALAHEVALTLALANWYPDLVLPVLATDIPRGWMLMPDGGVRLRLLSDEDRERRWIDLLPRYAEMQIDAARHRDELLQTRIPDRRPEHMPAAFESFFESERILGHGTRYAITSAELARLGELRPRIVELSEELASGPITATVQHDDLHDGNVFVRDANLFVFDWGDASVAHPFFSLRVALHRREPLLGGTVSTSALVRARDAYLEPWTNSATRAQLVEIAVAARLLSIVARILAWGLALKDVPELGDRAEGFPLLLRELLETG